MTTVNGKKIAAMEWQSSTGHWRASPPAIHGISTPCATDQQVLGFLEMWRLLYPISRAASQDPPGIRNQVRLENEMPLERPVPNAVQSAERSADHDCVQRSTAPKALSRSLYPEKKRPHEDKNEKKMKNKNKNKTIGSCRGWQE